MQTKYQVFISSTFKDLIEERQDTIKSVLEMGHLPAGMEAFPAADTEQFEYIKRVIDECDYYVLIIGARYGSVDSAGVSYTKKEYEYAVESGKTVLGFIHSAPELLPVAKADTLPDFVQKLEDFRTLVSKGRLVQFWTSREQLKSKVIISLHKSFADTPGIGWIRGNAAASEDLLAQINELRVRLQGSEERRMKLEKTQRPVFDDLAQLDDDVTIRFAYEQTIHSARSTTRRQKDEVTLAWSDIFLAIADDYSVPHTDLQINTGVGDHLRKKLSKPLSKFVLDSDDKIMIKLQFEALGLLKIWVGPTVSNTQAEFIQLTAMGKKELIERTVRRGASNVPASAE